MNRSIAGRCSVYHPCGAAASFRCRYAPHSRHFRCRRSRPSRQRHHRYSCFVLFRRAAPPPPSIRPGVRCAHEACTKVTDLAVAMCAVVEICVIRAPAVLHKWGKECLSRPEPPLLCPADAKVVAVRRDIGARLGAHRPLAHRRPFRRPPPARPPSPPTKSPTPPEGRPHD